MFMMEERRLCRRKTYSYYKNFFDRFSQAAFCDKLQMDINLAMQAVSTVGFPIVCCGALGWGFYKMNIQHTAQIKDLTENHRSEMNELKQALENNTLAVQKLCVMLSEKEAE